MKIPTEYRNKYVQQTKDIYAWLRENQDPRALLFTDPEKVFHDVCTGAGDAQAIINAAIEYSKREEFKP